MDSRLRYFARIFPVVMGLLLPLSLSHESHALSTKDITGPYKTSYQSWRKRGGYGAFSLSTTKSYCGFSWDNISLMEATTNAIKGCKQQRKNLKCMIVAENKTPSTYAQYANKCNSSSAQERIKACSWLIESKRDKGKAQAWNYTGRGNAYKDAGQLDNALNDYSKAIGSYKKWGWAWIDRAFVRFSQNDLDGALSDAQASLRYYDSRDYDYRNDAKQLIENINKELGRWKPMAEGELCSSALDAASVNCARQLSITTARIGIYLSHRLWSRRPKGEVSVYQSAGSSKPSPISNWHFCKMRRLR
jgi:tetratricopeptide (TPR) repeat protein